MLRSWQNFAARRGIVDMLKFVTNTGTRTYEELVDHLKNIGVEAPPLDSVKEAFSSLFPQAHPPPQPETKSKVTKKDSSETQPKQSASTSQRGT